MLVITLVNRAHVCENPIFRVFLYRSFPTILGHRFWSSDAQRRISMVHTLSGTFIPRSYYLVFYGIRMTYYPYSNSATIITTVKTGFPIKFYSIVLIDCRTTINCYCNKYADCVRSFPNLQSVFPSFYYYSVFLGLTCFLLRFN